MNRRKLRCFGHYSGPKPEHYSPKKPTDNWAAVSKTKRDCRTPEDTVPNMASVASRMNKSQAENAQMKMMQHLGYYCPGLHGKSSRQDIRPVLFGTLFSTEQVHHSAAMSAFASQIPTHRLCTDCDPIIPAGILLGTGHIVPPSSAGQARQNSKSSVTVSCGFIEAQN